MQNKICTRCGQSNFPNSNVCTNCGNPFSQASGGFNEPPPTMVVNQPSAPTPEKKSNKTFWIVGIIGLLLVMGIGLLAIVGIGGYLLYSGSEGGTEISTDSNSSGSDSNDNSSTSSGDSLGEIKFPGTGDSSSTSSNTNSTGSSSLGTATDEQLISLFKTQKSTVGKFTLDDVTSTSDSSKYPSKDAAVKAKYSSGSIDLTHEVAIYSDMDKLKTDFDSFISDEKSSGAKVETSTATSMVYVKGSLVYLAFSNPQGGFHIISSRNGKDILEYYNKYFGES